jgi:hypothetical protein
VDTTGPLPAIVSAVFGAAVLGKVFRIHRFLHSLTERLGSRRQALLLGLGAMSTESVISFSMWTPARRLGALLLIAFLLSSSAWLVSGWPAIQWIDLPSCDCFVPHRHAFGSPARISSSVKPSSWALRNGALAGAALALLTSSALWICLALGTAAISGVMSITMVNTIRKVRRRLTTCPRPIGT